MDAARVKYSVGQSVFQLVLRKVECSAGLRVLLTVVVRELEMVLSLAAY